MAYRHNGIPEQMPVNYESEQALLGAVLAENAAYENVAAFLKPEHFADPTHGRIFEACGVLIERGSLANAVTLKAQFDRDGELEDVGGAKYLSELQGNFISIVGARDYASTILELWQRRRLIEVAEDLAERAQDFDRDASAAQQIEMAEIQLSDIAGASPKGSGLQPVSAAIDQTISDAQRALEQGVSIDGLPTGLRGLDELLGGLHQGDLIILGARPSMGKTALATSIGVNAAKLRAPVAFFSLEMPSRQIAGRMIAAQAGISAHRLRRGRFDREDLEKVIRPGGQEIRALPLYLDDTPAITISAARAQARRMKRQHGLALVIFDYLQIAGVPRNQRRNRVDDVSDLSAGLKAMAKELDVPVIALSQLSRQLEQREDKRPQLSDLRDSGAIEQDADVVLFIYREALYAAQREPQKKPTQSPEKFAAAWASWQADLDAIKNKATVIVAKQRNGPIGDLELGFDPALTRFHDPDQQQGQAA